MAAPATFAPVNRQSTNTLAKAFGPVPNGFEYKLDVRVCAVGTADAAYDLQLRKTDGTNAGYRAKSHPVYLNTGTYDLERSLVLPAGYELWDRSGNGDVAASFTGTMRVVTTS